MLSTENASDEIPYKKFKKLFNLACEKKQEAVNAITVSSFDLEKNEVNSRYVNLKYIENDEWIFFSNYDSIKAVEFESHDQISVLLYWNALQIQIRMKALIKKTDIVFSNNHFRQRSLAKNALAISSRQSKSISSYELVEENYKKTLANANLLKRPEDWGGYSFTPYYFEFWQGNADRVNKRESFDLVEGHWRQEILQP